MLMHNNFAYLLVTLLTFAFIFMQRLVFASNATFTDSFNISSCFTSERNALFDFKHGLRDKSNRLSSWIRDDYCMWRGIRCSRRTGHVVVLDLRNPVDPSDVEKYYSHILQGELSNSLQYLEHLTHLDLSSNEFEGKIPDFLGSLANMRYLNLSNSLFTGKIPHHLGNLTRLQYLDLSNNLIENIGSLGWVSQLYSLKHLDLSSFYFLSLNNIIAINWFSAINMLPSLLVLNLRGCHLDFNNVPAHTSVNFTSLVSLDLSHNYQVNTTTIPHWLSNITSLVKLNLAENNYVGPIPDTIGTLCSLTFLDLSFNSFTTSLPTTIYKLRNLIHLDRSDNEFVGPIPTEMSNLTQLRYLNVYYNKLTGNLPPSFEKLSFMESLDIGSNRLSGTIPPFIAQLKKLKSLNMGGNALSGIIDENYINNLTGLTHLDFSSNSGVATNFSSSWTPPFQLKYLGLSYCKVGPRFPQWLRNQRNLNSLYLSNASIVDSIPHWFLSLNVQNLDLSENKLTGHAVLIHSNLEYLHISDNLFSRLMVANASTSLKMLFASNNLLTGAFPIWLCNMKSIGIIDLSNNQLSGRLPLCLGSFENLATLDLTSNSFYGSVPECLGSLVSLQSLHLRNNKFDGHLPYSFQNLAKLLTLDVGENAITGVIPPWIGESLSNLMVLSLQSNRFHGPIPQLLCQLSHLQTLNLAQNNITGSIPSCFHNLTAMIVKQNLDGYFFEDKILEHIQTVERLYYSKYFISVDLSNNNISGVIPMELMELLELVKLNVSGNHIDGRIPDQICNLRQLESLDLSRNKLSGPIPQCLSNLSFMSYLNMSFNDLSGKIPTGHQLQTLSDPSIYMGNKRLCGAPLNQCDGIHDASDQNSKEEPEGGEDEDNVDVWFYSGMGPGFSIGLLGFFGALYFNKRWRYAYLGFLENVYNTLAVSLAVKAAQLDELFSKR